MSPQRGPLTWTYEGARRVRPIGAKKYAVLIIALLGHYVAAQFTMAADGSGGTLNGAGEHGP